MAQERQWDAVPPQALTADGTALGVVTVADTSGFYVKGYAYLVNPIAGARQLQVQYVTPTTIVLGPMGSTPSVNNYVDVSAYTVALGSTVFFPQQSKNKIKSDDQDSATYAGDPIVARRVIPVDSHGDFYDENNPLPVNANVVIPPITVTVPPIDSVHDSVNIGDHSGNLTTTTTVGSKVGLDVNVIETVSTGIIKKPFDFVSGVYTSTTANYTFKIGGVGGTVVGTVNIVYTDTTKDNILTMAITNA